MEAELRQREEEEDEEEWVRHEEYAQREREEQAEALNQYDYPQYNQQPPYSANAEILVPPNSYPSTHPHTAHTAPAQPDEYLSHDPQQPPSYDYRGGAADAVPQRKLYIRMHNRRSDESVTEPGVTEMDVAVPGVVATADAGGTEGRNVRKGRNVRNSSVRSMSEDGGARKRRTPTHARSEKVPETRSVAVDEGDVSVSTHAIYLNFYLYVTILLPRTISLRRTTIDNGNGT